MISQKLFAQAAGRRFRIQAKSRATQELVVLARNLSEEQCRAWEPGRLDRQLYTYFRVAYADS